MTHHVTQTDDSALGLTLGLAQPGVDLNASCPNATGHDAACCYDFTEAPVFGGIDFVVSSITIASSSVDVGGGRRV